jgi:hypothetical protein
MDIQCNDGTFTVTRGEHKDLVEEGIIQIPANLQPLLQAGAVFPFAWEFSGTTIELGDQVQLLYKDATSPIVNVPESPSEDVESPESEPEESTDQELTGALENRLRGIENQVDTLNTQLRLLHSQLRGAVGVFVEASQKGEF